MEKEVLIPQLLVRLNLLDRFWTLLSQATFLKEYCGLFVCVGLG